MTASATERELWREAESGKRGVTVLMEKWQPGSAFVEASRFFRKNLCPVGAHTGAFLSSSSTLWSGWLGYRIGCCLFSGSFQTLNLASWGIRFGTAHCLWHCPENQLKKCRGNHFWGGLYGMHASYMFRQSHHLELHSLDLLELSGALNQQEKMETAMLLWTASLFSSESREQLQLLHLKIKYSVFYYQLHSENLITMIGIDFHLYRPPVAAGLCWFVYLHIPRNHIIVLSFACQKILGVLKLFYLSALSHLWCRAYFALK